MITYQKTNSFSNYNYNAFIYHNCNWLPHFHENLELIYIISGEVEAIIDGHTELLRENVFALVLPNQIHSYRTEKESCAWVGVFSEDFVRSFSLHMKDKQGKVASFVCDEATRTFLLQKLINEQTPSLNIRKACLYAVCDQYVNNVSIIDRKPNNDRLLYNILEYISNHFTDDITLIRMSEDLGYEYHYLSRCFHKTFHMNFRQMVNQYRFAYAKNLLIEGNLSITEIALKSGFQSIRSFNQIFKDITGAQPREYLKSVP